MRLNRGLLWGTLLAAAACIAPQAAEAQRSGKQIVAATCAGCHGEGVNGAPKIGDDEAWKKRAAQGLTSLTRHALDGIRGMPAHGGNLALTDLEIARAVTTMVNRSGGRWVEPASELDLAGERSGAQIVEAQCSKCHREGVGGAPKIGDVAAWAPRLKGGLDGAVRAAIHGHGGMPPRGDRADLTDAEVRNAVLYMFNPGAVAPKGAPVAALAARPRYKIAGGMEVDLGIVPADTLRLLPEGSAERALHGGVPDGAGYYHFNVSLRDARSRAPIADAQVVMRVEQVGLSGVTKTLEPYAINDVPSYGDYFRLRWNAHYRITAIIRRPGKPDPVAVKFEHRTY
ncbi:MAG: c-type cytochrome [Betaproteobacteria bacterium]|nr:c-type cytochrome [Betaproteobacteria bacterium]MDH4324089.1 c-type cytochrome [Betaproteobacteria bacterium]